MERLVRIEVLPRADEAPTDFPLSDIRALGIQSVRYVKRHPLYFLYGALSDMEVERLSRELLADRIIERAVASDWDAPLAVNPGEQRIEVGLLQGVTDTVADNLVARAYLLGIRGLSAASTAVSYRIASEGALSPEVLQQIADHLLCNQVIEFYALGALPPHIGTPHATAHIRVETVPLRELDDDALLGLSRVRLLSLDLAEMHAVQAYYREAGREPTDVELESIAQTWSEHCVHKTFKGIVEYREETADGTREQRIDSLIKTYLQAATNQINAPWVLSAFVDNAGIIAFDEQFEISFKAETHNHPSALEPFGGANTGVGGVVRDIMGVSARPIANTDVFCFGPLDIPPEDLPAGVLHPRRIYNGVVDGVEDYGNKMGIPTVNGAILFEPGYVANPLVYCGCVGIAPRGLHVSQAQPGDLVVVLGGRTGRDGLHGATFSSIELTDETGETSGGAVQIGNPIVEKMVLDALLVCRDRRLYNAITDCGAGGLSSAVSEMGEATGVEVNLERVPLKYDGLQPWEIWLSEAQERMVIAVSPSNEAAVRQVCEHFSVEMTVIGTFGTRGRLLLKYEDELVADLEMRFLHKGVPRRTLKGVWVERREADPVLTPATSLGEDLLAIMAHPNLRSKEDVVRKYDHEVQGGTFIKPFVGLHLDGPSDGAVIRPLDASESWRGFALGCGINPAYGEIDPHAMAVAAIDEAVRNVVCVGADPAQVAILDNFCWGNPKLPDRMGSLVRACQGCYDGALQFGTPFISGKDSLNNEYLDTVSGQQVAIPPSLLISAIGIVPDVRRSCSMDFKAAGNCLYVVGETRPELGGSYYYRLHGEVGSSVPRAAAQGPAIAAALHKAIAASLVRACHDCSEGGLAAALAEMALAGRLGAQVSLQELPCPPQAAREDAWLLFSESLSRYVVEVAPEHAAAFETAMGDLPWGALGEVTAEARLVIAGLAGNAIDLEVTELVQAFNGHIGGKEQA